MHRSIRLTGGRWTGGAVLSIAALTLFACDRPESRETAKREAAREGSDRNACADQATYERLKAAAFEKAREVRTGDGAMLDRLSETASVRMDNPAIDGRDEALGVTVCKGRMTIDLPPGFKDAFNGDQQLTANVKYAVQAGAEQSVRAFPLEGTEPIVYRLAAIDLKSGKQVAQSAAASASTPKRSASPRGSGAAESSARRVAGLEPRLSTKGRPAFNCSRVRSRAERMICSDERLAAFDRVMASLYDRALDDSDRQTRAALRGTQNRFFARRDRCRSTGCVAAVYRARLDEIDRIASEG